MVMLTLIVFTKNSKNEKFYPYSKILITNLSVQIIDLVLKSFIQVFFSSHVYPTDVRPNQRYL